MKLKINILIVFSLLTLAGFMFYFFHNHKTDSLFDPAIRTEILDTVKLIENYGDVTNGVVGYSGKTPQQWHRRQWLMQNATDKELLTLTDYPSGAVKATAYEGLFRKDNSNRYDSILKALNDTTTFFNYQVGCEGNITLLSEYLMTNVLFLDDSKPTPPKPLRFKEYTDKLSKEELDQVKRMYKNRIEKKWNYYYADNKLK
ncbi:hypothetical protein [Catalinimonas niigatensis]|uniref:hypothetical protein n=1 Tax=Catalinimonas niigatensis TaxID=1397264 RepID=UPI002666B703|nr:hypothetical protein [Catalinimonas niigatensis]WPP47978.1 hypothetical protein PZB72_14970 [Catalinimonas niigatensis]